MTVSHLLSLCYTFIDRVSTGIMQSPLSVCSSVRQSVSTLTFKASDLRPFLCTSYDHGSPWIEGQGQRSRSNFKSQGQRLNAVGLRANESFATVISAIRDKLRNRMDVSCYPVMYLRPINKSIVYSRLRPRCHNLMNWIKHWLSDAHLVSPPGELIQNITSCLILTYWSHGIKT